MLLQLSCPGEIIPGDRGGQPSFHSRWTSFEVLQIYRQNQSKRRLCLAQAGPQLGCSLLWGLK